MKRFLMLLICLALILSSGCFGKGREKTTIGIKIESDKLERIVITNNRYSGRYTVIDESTIQRLYSEITAATVATEKNTLEPDFIIDLYSGEKREATFKYIAGINDKGIGNIIDENGRQYNVNTSLEDEFMKRILKRDNFENVPQYYISLIKLIVEKNSVLEGAKVVVDISKDFSVSRSMISVEQESILDSIDYRNVRIYFPGEIKNPDYIVKISTEKYYNNTCETTVSATDKKGKTIEYEIKGTFEDDRWSFHIKYK